MNNKDKVRIMKWTKDNTKQFIIRLNILNDEDVINKLESVPNKVQYIRDLIKKDIKKRGKS